MLKNAWRICLPSLLTTPVLIVAMDAPASAPAFLPAANVGSVAPAAINEASGLAASRANPGVLWLHNDSGDSPRVFALSTAGSLLGTYGITGASAVDWEDIALGPGPAAGQQYLYLGDIGDNSATRGISRPAIAVYRVPEPAVSPTQAPVTVNLAGAAAFTLAYPDGPRDAETLIIDPLSGDLYVISKREALGRVYRAPAASLVDGATITLQYKTELPWSWATGGDVSPDGDEVIVRGYWNASLWPRTPGAELWQAFAAGEVVIPLAVEPQGEAIAFDPAGWGYYTTSEGLNQPIYYFDRLPAPAALPLLLLGATTILRAPRRRTGLAAELAPRVFGGPLASQNTRCKHRR